MKKTIILGLVAICLTFLVTSDEPMLGDDISPTAGTDVMDYVADTVERAYWKDVPTENDGKPGIASQCNQFSVNYTDCQKRTLYNNFNADSRYCNNWDISDEGKNCLEWLNHEFTVFIRMKMQEHTDQIFTAMYEHTLVTPSVSFDGEIDIDLGDTPGVGDLG